MRRLTEYEIWTIIHTEQEESLLDSSLSMQEIEEYLKTIKIEIEETWNIFDYYTYWENYESDEWTEDYES